MASLSGIGRTPSVGAAPNTGSTTAQKPLSQVAAQVEGLLNKYLDKLGPQGKALKPLLDTFIKNAGSLSTSGGLAGLNTMLKAAPAMCKLPKLVDGVINACGGLESVKKASPAALQNLTELVASRQASLIS